MSIDSKIIIILGLCAVLAIALDDRVGDRWCQTYDWCSEDIVLADGEKNDAKNHAK